MFHKKNLQTEWKVFSIDHLSYQDVPLKQDFRDNSEQRFKILKKMNKKISNQMIKSISLLIRQNTSIQQKNVFLQFKEDTLRQYQLGDLPSIKIINELITLLDIIEVEADLNIHIIAITSDNFLDGLMLLIHKWVLKT